MQNPSKEQLGSDNPEVSGSSTQPTNVKYWNFFRKKYCPLCSQAHQSNAVHVSGFVDPVIRAVSGLGFTIFSQNLPLDFHKKNTSTVETI